MTNADAGLASAHHNWDLYYPEKNCNLREHLFTMHYSYAKFPP